MKIFFQIKSDVGNVDVEILNKVDFNVTRKQLLNGPNLKRLSKTHAKPNRMITQMHTIKFCD